MPTTWHSASTVFLLFINVFIVNISDSIFRDVLYIYSAVPRIRSSVFLFL